VIVTWGFLFLVASGLIYPREGNFPPEEDRVVNVLSEAQWTAAYTVVGVLGLVTLIVLLDIFISQLRIKRKEQEVS
jgi:hypothetical protein